MIDLLLWMLVPALNYVNGVDTRNRLIPVVLAATLLDMLIAHTTWRALTGPLQGSEKTISDSLERLCHPSNGLHEDYDLFCQIALKINRACKFPHIKVVASWPNNASLVR
jgi:hypothetical protein